MTRDELVGPPDEVARRLLGARLVAGDVVVRLVDLEAYGGADDAASHAFRGETARNRSMFGRPGLLYVYLSYGVHSCANIVCAPEGQASAVLVRGVEVLAGEATVTARRPRGPRKGRLDGPGRVCQGLGLDRTLDGVDLLALGSPVLLEPGTPSEGESVVAGPRIGISKEADRPWRFRLAPADATGRGDGHQGLR